MAGRWRVADADGDFVPGLVDDDNLYEWEIVIIGCVPPFAGGCGCRTLIPAPQPGGHDVVRRARERMNG